MTIHSEHPFLEPERDPVRQLRGRLGGAVTLGASGGGASGGGASGGGASGGGDGPLDRAGLTVTSVLVANGQPPRLLALLDPDSDLADKLAETGLAVVALLTWDDRALADAFGGTAPAPGGAFRMGEFVQTPWGPRLAGAATWAGVRLESSAEVGWSSLVTCVIEELEVGDDEPLVHRRGRYQR